MNKLAQYLSQPRTYIALFGAFMAVEEAVRPLLQGDAINWNAVATAAFGALFGYALKYRADSTPKQVEAKLQVARQSAASAAYVEGVRASQPPTPWVEGPIPDLPTPQPRGKT